MRRRPAARARGAARGSELTGCAGGVDRFGGKGREPAEVREGGARQRRPRGPSRADDDERVRAGGARRASRRRARRASPARRRVRDRYSAGSEAEARVGATASCGGCSSATGAVDQHGRLVGAALASPPARARRGSRAGSSPRSRRRRGRRRPRGRGSISACVNVCIWKKSPSAIASVISSAGPRGSGRRCGRC